MSYKLNGNDATPKLNGVIVTVKLNGTIIYDPSGTTTKSWSYIGTSSSTYDGIRDLGELSSCLSSTGVYSYLPRADSYPTGYIMKVTHKSMFGIVDPVTGIITYDCQTYYFKVVEQ